MPGSVGKLIRWVANCIFERKTNKDTNLRDKSRLLCLNCNVEENCPMYKGMPKTCTFFKTDWKNTYIQLYLQIDAELYSQSLFFSVRREYSGEKYMVYLF